VAQAPERVKRSRERAARLSRSTGRAGFARALPRIRDVGGRIPPRLTFASTEAAVGVGFHPGWRSPPRRRQSVSDSTPGGVRRPMMDRDGHGGAQPRENASKVVQGRHPARPVPRRGGFTRTRPAVVRRVPPPVESDRKRSPAMPPEGAAIHRWTSRPRTGNAASNSDANRPTRRRFAVRSPTTSSRLIGPGARPRSRAIFGATRTFRSSGASVPWASAITALTSTTRRLRDAARQPRMSIEPRSP